MSKIERLLDIRDNLKSFQTFFDGDDECANDFVWIALENVLDEIGDMLKTLALAEYESKRIDKSKSNDSDEQERESVYSPGIGACNCTGACRITGMCPNTGDKFYGARTNLEPYYWPNPAHKLIEDIKTNLYNHFSSIEDIRTNLRNLQSS